MSGRDPVSARPVPAQGPVPARDPLSAGDPVSGRDPVPGRDPVSGRDPVPGGGRVPRPPEWPARTPWPAHDHASRRDRLRQAFAAAGIDLLLVTAPANVAYLSGFTGSNGQLVVSSRADDDRLITDARYEERAASEAPALPVALSRDPVAVALDLGGAARLGVEAEHLSWSTARELQRRATDHGTEVVPTAGLVEALRVVKDETELVRLRRACELTVAALDWLVEEVAAVGRTERELATALERRFVDLGADGVAFPSIVASGPHSAIPHHRATDRALAAGDLLTIDCGALLDGYHADFTRTFAVGHLTPDLVAVHELVQAAQEAGRRASVAGSTGGEVDAAAREVITAGGHAERFVHGTGHGVGLDIHEAPTVARGARATLEARTAMTVEPGVYLPGSGGVRIEDTLVITADGPPTTLTTARRDLRVLPRGR
jgi:Xaa-Pro aminopeptidase